MKTSWRSASLVASAAAVLALTTACGQESSPSVGSQNVGATAAAGGYGSVGAGSSASASPGNGYGADGQAQAQAAGKLAITENAKVGKMLTDGAGKTLYRFDQDTA